MSDVYDDAVLVLKPSGYDEGVLFSQKPEVVAGDAGYPASVGDFTVTSDSLSVRVNESLLFEPLLPDTPLLDYLGGGCPKSKLFPQRTRLNEHPDDLTDAYWSKSGATIDPTAVNAPMMTPKVGSELVTAWTDSDFTSFASTGVNITQMVASASGENCYSLATIVSGNYYKLSFTSTQAIGCDFYFANSADLSGGQNVLTVAAGANEIWVEASASYTHCGFVSTAAFTDTQISDFTLATISNGSSGTQWKAAWKLVESSGVSESHRFETNSSLTNATDYSYWMIAKADERTWCRIAAAVNGEADAYFDLENGVVGTVTSGTAKIQALADGWYICSVTGTSSGTGLVARYFVAESDGVATYIGDGTSGIKVFFPTWEQGSYSTYPIWSGVSAGTETREVDDIALSDLQTNSILGSTTGMVMFEVDATDNPGADTDLYLLEDTGGGDELGLRFLSSEKWQWYDHHSTELIGSPSTSDACKIAITWSGTAAIISIDGTSEVITLTAALDAITDISNGASFVGADTKEIVMSSTYWTAANLNSLTQ